MVIIQLYKELDRLDANNLRIKNVKETQNGNLKKIFEYLGQALTAGNKGNIKLVLQEKIFFEEIPNECIDQIAEVFSKIPKENINTCISMLQESYLIRGTRGYRFTFTPILKRIG